MKIVSVNLANERAHLELLGKVDAQTLLDAVSKAGYSASVWQAEHPQTDDQQRRLQHERWALICAIALALPLVLPMVLQPFGIHWMLPAWAQFALATPVQFIFGARFYVAAWKAVRAGAGNMDLLVALGTSAGYGLSLYEWATAAGRMPHLYFEASAVVIALVLLGKYLESRAKRQTASAIRALEALRPERATQVIDGREQDVAISALRLNDQVLVKPGERFPVDGEVLEGQSHADEALISGESLPVPKQPGTRSPVARSTVKAGCWCAPPPSARKACWRGSSVWSKTPRQPKRRSRNWWIKSARCSCRRCWCWPWQR